MDFWLNLFDTSDFPARWYCGRWTAGHGWLHILSDLGIWSAYFAIPCVLLYFTLRRQDLPFRKIFLLFVAFILLCGTTHLMEAIIFWWPVYRLAGVIKFLTAAVSWTTVAALVQVAPRALAMRSPEELEREVVARKKAEEELKRANEELERRVEDRTGELLETAVSLRNEREWFRTTLASIGDAVIVTDDGGRVMFLNPVAESLTGWKMLEAQGHFLDDVFRIINENSRQPVESPVRKALREGRTVGLANHTLLIAKDGTERPVEDSAAPIQEGDNSIQGVVLVFRDASEQRKLERLRATRLAVTQHLARGLDVRDSMQRILHDVGTNLEWEVGLYWEVDPEEEVLRCKETWHADSNSIQPREFEKVSREATPGKDSSFPGRVWRACAPEWIADVTGDPNFVRGDAASQAGLRGAFACPVFADGAVFGVFEFYSREVREPDADLLEIMTSLGGQIGQFIERKKAESQLRETEQRTHSVVDHVVDGIITIDEHGRIETFNPAAEKLFGYRASEIIGQNVRELMPEPYRGEHDGYIGNYSRTGEAKIIGIGREVLGKRKDGSTFPMELAVSEFRLKERRYFTGIVRDISERKQTENELRQVAAELSEANRRKTEFLATLAHELRNPLAPIRTGLEVIKMVKHDPEKLEEIRSTMERQTQQLITLVDDLLDVSRITRGKLRLRKCRVNLADIVKSAVEAVEPLFDEADQNLSLTIPSQPIYLDADPHRLAQVFSNLLNNASKYSPEGGEISLSVKRAESEVVVAVRDRGIGIANDQYDAIFAMFTQIEHPAGKSYTGLGIGLTLVKSLVELHGGTVEVESEGLNRGSEFRVRLPLAAEMPVDHSEENEPKESVPPSSRLRVLVVDDNSAAVEMLSLMVKMLGNDVRTACDGREAVQVAEKFRPDVVLMDLGMPHMNGYEAARHIRQQPWGDDMVLVALTGWGQDEDKQRTREVGFDHHLVKPAEPSELQRLLEQSAEKLS